MRSIKAQILQDLPGFELTGEDLITRTCGDQSIRLKTSKNRMAFFVNVRFVSAGRDLFGITYQVGDGQESTNTSYDKMITYVRDLVISPWTAVMSHIYLCPEFIPALKRKLKRIESRTEFMKFLGGILAEDIKRNHRDVEALQSHMLDILAIGQRHGVTARDVKRLYDRLKKHIQAAWLLKG